MGMLRIHVRTIQHNLSRISQRDHLVTQFRGCTQERDSLNEHMPDWESAVQPGLTKTSITRAVDGLSRDLFQRINASANMLHDKRESSALRTNNTVVVKFSKGPIPFFYGQTIVALMFKLLL